MVSNMGILLGLLFGLMGSGLYIGLSLAGAGVVGIELLRHLGSVIGNILYGSIASYVLSAVPMFLLLGNLVLNSGLSGRLYKGVSQWTRIVPGGLLHSNILACSIFAAISGSSAATAATIGTVAYSEQKKRGYDMSVVAGSLAAGGTLGILIPPSITLIIYGAFVGASVGRLFAGGVVPGIILSLLFMCYISVISVKNKDISPPHQKVTRRYFVEAIAAVKEVFPLLLIIVAIMGSIYGGIMTPTEAAAVSVFMALILGAIFGKINFTILKDSAVGALRTTAMIGLIFGGASILGGAMGLLQLPHQLGVFIAQSGLSPMMVWMAIILLYLVLGCVMDNLAALLVTLPVTYPAVVTIGGFDPIWFGVQCILLSEIAMITPPVGINLFVIQGVIKEVPLGRLSRNAVPYVVILLAMVGLTTLVPDLILFLPCLMMN